MTKSWCQSDSYKSFALLVGRVIVGVIFILAGWGKFQNMEMVSGMFAGWGFPAATFFAWLTALVEFVGGLGLVLGIFTKVWGMLLSVTMLVAVLAVHIPQGDGFQMMQPALTLLATCLVISSVGGGAFKLWSKECPWS